MGDDIGLWNVSAYNRGMMGYRTPNIDRIARDGAIFTDYYGQQSCTAGRAAFITGQSPIRTGLLKVGLPGAPEGLSEKDPTIADMLKPLGYATGQFGKNHLGDRNEFLPTVHGFDEFFGNLYHLNAEEEPENIDYPKDPTFKAQYGPRGVLKCVALPNEAPGEDPRFGKWGKQKCEDTGPLTKKRMEIGTSSSVLVRDDVHPEIIGLLARALVEVHSEPGIFQQYGDFPTQADPEYPMAESARDFYKNGPSFLQRYLPFWVTSYVRKILAVLVTALAIAVPVFSYAPKLYLWLLRRHVSKLYRELRVVESGLRPGLSGPQLAEYEDNLDKIDRASSVLPMRHSDLFFSMRTHIDLTRVRLRSLLDEAHERGAQKRPAFHAIET